MVESILATDPRSIPHVVVKGGARLERTPRPPGTAGWWRMRRERGSRRQRLLQRHGERGVPQDRGCSRAGLPAGGPGYRYPPLARLVEQTYPRRWRARRSRAREQLCGELQDLVRVTVRVRVRVRMRVRARVSVRVRVRVRVGVRVRMRVCELHDRVQRVQEEHECEPGERRGRGAVEPGPRQPRQPSVHAHARHARVARRRPGGGEERGGELDEGRVGGTARGGGGEAPPARWKQGAHGRGASAGRAADRSRRAEAGRGLGVA